VCTKQPIIVKEFCGGAYIVWQLCAYLFKCAHIYAAERRREKTCKVVIRRGKPGEACGNETARYMRRAYVQNCQCFFLQLCTNAHFFWCVQTSYINVQLCLVCILLSSCVMRGQRDSNFYCYNLLFMNKHFALSISLLSQNITRETQYTVFSLSLQP